MNHVSIGAKLNVALFAAVTAAVLAAPAAHAAIVYVDWTNTPLSIADSIDGTYINLVTGVSGGSAGDVTGWDLNPYDNTVGLTFYGAASPLGILATGTPGIFAETVRLSFGDLIGPAGQYNQFQTRGTSFEGITGLSYMGLRFINEGTSATNYAWAEFQTMAHTGFPAALLRYAYEDTGAPITAGAVPEPSTFALFGMALAGAAGFSAIRRRRPG